MFQLYNSDNYITKFIKDLLKDTYIPMIPVWKENTPLIKDFLYIYNNNVVRALLSWKPGDKDELGQPITPNFSERYFNVIHTYEFGKQYYGETSNFVSNSSLYDSDTHKFLGEYLRMIRDLKHLNLMPYYNCFSGVYSDRLRFNPVSQTERIINNNTKDDGQTCLIVPIKFNQEYTIYADCDDTVIFMPAYYDGVNLIDAEAKNNLSKQLHDFYKTESNISFANPKVYKIELSTDKLDSSGSNNLNNYYMNKYLTLLIQLPKEKSANVVVLEGNYKENKFFDVNKTKQIRMGSGITSADEEKYYITVPSLTANISNISYAFSDRLVEYLLLNVIDNIDMISQDIERIQEYISSRKLEEKFGVRYNYKYPAYTKGVWRDSVRRFIYDLSMNNPYSNRYDINGYVDKDTETILLGGK